MQRKHALAGLIVDGAIDDGAIDDGAIDDGAIDWSPWYLTDEEDMSQSGEQSEIIGVLVSSLKTLAAERNWSSVYVGCDNFFAWVQDEPCVQVSPDVYLLDNPPPSDQRLPRRWETWRPDHRPPRFAVEIVSLDWKKDYTINPARYDHLGTDELVIADADAFTHKVRNCERVPFQVFRRDTDDVLKAVDRGSGPVYCAELAAYLCFHHSPGEYIQVRVTRDAEGLEPVPTAREMVHAQAAHIEAQAAELESQAAELESQATQIEALRARLRQLDGS